MKVVGVNTSPRRRGNTYKIIKMILDAVDGQEIETEIISLSAFKDFRFCLGCCDCLTNPERASTEPGAACIQKDDLGKILAPILSADGIVLGTPVYINGVSAHLKNLIDRCCGYSHRPPLLGKYSIVVSPTAGSGLDVVLGYERMWLEYLGTQVIGELGVLAPHYMIVEEEKVREKAAALGRELAQHVIAKPEMHPTELQRRFFQAMKRKVTRTLEWAKADTKYWGERGWFDEKEYFTQ